MKNYDRHGWEEVVHCVERAKEIVSLLEDKSIMKEIHRDGSITIKKL